MYQRSILVLVFSHQLPPLGDALSFGGDTETDLLDREYLDVEDEIGETDTETTATDDTSTLNPESTTSDTGSTDTTTG